MLSADQQRPDRGASFLDRIIPADVDWRQFEHEEERGKVLPMSSFLDQIKAHFNGTDTEAQGAYWPWGKMNDKGMRFRPGEVTLYAGVNGHRKSMITTQIALGLMRQQQPTLIESFEMRPMATFARMARQAAGCASPSDDYIERLAAWSAHRVWAYDHHGDCPPRQAMAVARYAAQVLGVRHVVIDSLMKVINGTDDYNGQKNFVSGLCTLAKANDVHVHLVAHARKGNNSNDMLDKWDVKGASEITDQVDNVILLNKVDKPDDKGPTQWLQVAKQRNGAFEGAVGLYFDEESQSCSGEQGHRWVGVLRP